MKPTPFKALYFVLCFTFLTIAASANPYISRPEIVGYLGASFNFCQGFNLTLKFDADQMNGGNTFIVQLSDSNGNFSAARSIGTLAAGNGQNQLINATIPFNTPAGPRIVTPTRGYRVRIVSTNPGGVVSVPNEFPFKVIVTTPVTNPQPSRYGVDQWVGHVYTWQLVQPTIGGLVNPAIQNFYDPANYKGYFTLDTLSFDLNWDRGPMPLANGVRVDSNMVSCEYRENFAVRFRRRHTFPLGYYSFQFGGDDGIRFSTDGGATWYYDSFREQQYSPQTPNNGCGVPLSGTMDLVIEFFQRFVQARVTARIIKTGDPNQNPAFAAGQDGRSFCASDRPIQLVATPAGGNFVGPGVNASGLFTPRNAGLGVRTIRYVTGLGACQKESTIQLTVNPGSDARFAGLDTAYCLSNTTIQLQTLAQGVFDGPGVVGSTFNPQLAGVGTHRVRHVVATIAQCPDTVIQTVRVYAPLPPLSFSLPRTTFCSNDAPVQSTFTALPNGRFFGRGIDQSGLFNPQGLSGTIRLIYKALNGPCSDSVIVPVTVNFAARATISGLDSAYCFGAPPVNLITVQPGFFAGPGMSGQTFSPASLAPGIYEIQYILLGLCPDTARQRIRIRPAIAPAFVGLPSSLCTSGGSITLQASPAGGTFSGLGVSGNTFNPAGLSGSISIKYKVSNGFCSDSTTGVITITTTPTITLLTDSIVCVNSGPYTLRAAQPGGVWSGPGLNGGDTFDPLVVGTGRFPYTYSINQTGCSGSATVFIRITGISNMQFEKSDEVCYNEPVGLRLTATPATAYTVVISNQAGQTLATGTQATDFSGLKLEQSANLRFVLTEVGSTCSYTFSDVTPGAIDPSKPSFVAVALGIRPSFRLDTLSGSAIYPMRVRLNNNSEALTNGGQTTFPIPTGARLDYTIDWGDGSVETFRNLTNAEHTYQTETVARSPYQIKLTANDVSYSSFSRCATSSQQELEVRLGEWPNVITPNEDGKNDALVFLGLEGKAKFTVFNRYGIQVYNEDKVSNTFKGDNLPAGTYFYKLVEDNGREYKGWVQILK